MVITVTDLKTNLGSYLERLSFGDIIVTQNGRKVARLVEEEEDSISNIHSLFGILADSELAKMDDSQLKEIIREERCKKYDGTH